MAESQAVLQLKEKNARLRQANRNAREDYEGIIRRKNAQLDALHFVWCSGGCPRGVRTEVTAEMVAYVEEYAKRLRQWFVNRAGTRVMEQMDRGELLTSEQLDVVKASWTDAKAHIAVARDWLLESTR